MDIGRAFSYVTEDENWISKLLMAGLVSVVLGLIPLVGLIGALALQGYVIETARNVMRGNPRPIPDWSDFGGKIGIGFSSAVVSLVYVLVPLIALTCIISSIISAGAAAAGSNENAGSAVGAVALCLMGIAFLALIALIPFVMASQVRFIQTGSIAASLRFGDIWTMVRNAPSTWLMLLLVSLVASFVGSLGFIACGIGIIITLPYSQLVLAHVLGQVAGQTAGASQGPGQTPPGYGPPTYQ